MAVIPWINYNEQAVGHNHPTLADVVNRPLRQLLTSSGYDPDADIGTGFAKTVHTHSATQITGEKFGTGNYEFPAQLIIDSTLIMGAGIVFKTYENTYPRTTNLNLDYTLHQFVAFDCTAGALSAFLPSATFFPAGMMFIVKKVDASANNLILDGSGAGQIDGVNTKSVNTQYARIMVISSGNKWQQII